MDDQTTGAPRTAPATADHGGDAAPTGRTPAAAPTSLANPRRTTL